MISKENSQFDMYQKEMNSLKTEILEIKNAIKAGTHDKTKSDYLKKDDDRCKYFRSKVRCPNCRVTKKFYVHCFNCEENDHIRKDCPFEINAEDKKTNEGCMCGTGCNQEGVACAGQDVTKKGKSQDLYKKVICAIEELETLNIIKMEKEIYLDDGDKIPVKFRRSLVKLVGERPLINCLLDDHRCQALWDTGSMISLVDELFLKQYFPIKVIYSVNNFVSENLNLKAANNTDDPVKGVVIMNFCMESCEFVVPFLATKEVLANPVLGFNVIAYMISKATNAIPMLTSMLDISQMNAETMINLIEAGGETPDLLDEIKLWKSKIIPGHTRITIKCKTKILFEGNEKLVLFPNH